MRKQGHVKQRMWLREAGVYGMLFGIPLVLLFPYTPWRPGADFNASVRTQAIDFVVGANRLNGPFTDSRACADLSFERFAKVQLPGTWKWKSLGGESDAVSTDVLWGGTVHFKNVKFQSLLLTKDTRVKMNWYEPSPTGVTVRVFYSAMPSAAAAMVFLTDKSIVEFTSSRFSESGKPENGRIQGSIDMRGLASLYPREDLSFPVSISPCAPGSAELSPPARSGEPAKPAAPQSSRALNTSGTLPAATDIPLSRGSRITFLTDDDSSAILGFDNTVQVTNAERKETLLEGQRLEIADVRDRSNGDPSQLSLQIKDGIAVRLLGRAGGLLVDGVDARPSQAEYLRAQKILSAWLTTAILLGSAALTVASRIKLVKLDEKDG